MQLLALLELIIPLQEADSSHNHGHGCTWTRVPTAADAEVAAVKCDDDKPGTRVKSLRGSGVYPAPSLCQAVMNFHVCRAQNTLDTTPGEMFGAVLPRPGLRKL